MKPYLMSNFPSVRPSLNLQFDSQPTPADMTSHLASVGATFSRASIGTYTDANGLVQEATSGQARPNYSTDGVHEGLLIEEARTNLIKSSEDLTDSNWEKEADVFVLENQAIAPNGKASADKLVYPSTDEFHRTAYDLSVTSGTTYSFSAYVKADGYNFVLIRWGGFVSGGQDNVSFDLVDVETDFVSNNFDSASIEAVGNDWYKITVVGTAYANSSSIFRIRFQPTAQTDGSIDRFTGDGESGGFVWGAQFEAGSFPTSYIPTIPTFSSRASSATFFNSSGVLSTASTNVARTDHKYIDGEWVEAGLLLEGQSTNLLLQSEDINTTWFKNAGDVSVNQISAPDGNTTADLFKPTSTDSGVKWFYQSRNISTGTDYTASIFAKAQNLNHLRVAINSRDSVSEWAVIQCDLSDGSFTTGTSGSEVTLVRGNVTDVGNGWYRIEITVNTTDGSIYVLNSLSDGTAIGSDSRGGLTFSASNTTDGVYVWGAQLEAQSQPTSYIATSGSTVTRSADVYTTATKVRSADVCYIDGTAFTDFYNDDAGTVFVDFKQLSNVNVAGDVFQFSDNSFDNRIENFLDSDGHLNTRYAVDGSNFNATQYESFTPSNQNKLANVFDGNTNEIYVNGAEVANNDSMTSTPNGLDRLYIGSAFNSSLTMNATYKKFIHFPRALQVTEIQKLTQ